jgi:hypothetical protein
MLSYRTAITTTDFGVIEEKLAAAIKNSDLAINELKRSLVIDSEMLHSAFNL